MSRKWGPPQSADGQKVIEKVRAKYYVLISETSVFEIGNTRNSAERKRLVDVCKQLLQAGECVMPHNWIMQRMAECNWRYKERFRWDEVDIRGTIIEHEIVSRQFLSQDSISEEGRLHAKEEKKALRQIFAEALEEFKPAFTEEVKAMTLEEFIGIYKADGGPFWKHISSLHAHTERFPLNETEAKAFVKRCPPYHAMTLSMAIAHYQYGLPRKDPAPYDTGPFDLFMSIYLPYCDFFVTDDPGQLNATRAIAKEVGMSVTVICYRDFADQLLM